MLTKAKPMEPFNILVLGADYRKGDTRIRTDSMMVAHVDPKAEEGLAAFHSRATRASRSPGTGRQDQRRPLLWRPRGAIDAGEKLTGLKINHYLEANFQGFVKAVDALGGVWVNVPYTIDDKQADHSKGDKASHIDAGYQLLDGPHALTFVRARHSSPTRTSRA